MGWGDPVEAVWALFCMSSAVWDQGSSWHRPQTPSQMTDLCVPSSDVTIHFSCSYPAQRHLDIHSTKIALLTDSRQNAFQKLKKDKTLEGPLGSIHSPTLCSTHLSNILSISPSLPHHQHTLWFLQVYLFKEQGYFVHRKHYYKKKMALL